MDKTMTTSMVLKTDNGVEPSTFSMPGDLFRAGGLEVNLTRYGRLGLLEGEPEEGTSGTCRGCRGEANYPVKGSAIPLSELSLVCDAHSRISRYLFSSSLPVFSLRCGMSMGLLYFNILLFSRYGFFCYRSFERL
nr:unnamed protein product [Haemonchus contortus]